MQDSDDYDYSNKQGSIGGSLGSLGSVMLVGLNREKDKTGTTQAAVSEGVIDIRDPDSQRQDLANLSRDVDNANDSVNPIFDKDRERRRLQEVQLISEIAQQSMDIIRTHGEIEAAKAQNDPQQREQARQELQAAGKDATNEAINQHIYQQAMHQYGTGSDYQKAAQAVTAVLQGLAGGDIGAALAGGAAPYLATEIKKATEGNETARLMAHAVLGALVAEAQGNSGLAGAAGAAAGEGTAMLLAKQMYDKPLDKLTEQERQVISGLSTLTAGVSGAVTGDVSDAIAGAQAGKNATENNELWFSPGMMNYGQSAASLDKYLQQNGATLEERTEAQRALAKGQGFDGPMPANELVNAWIPMMLGGGSLLAPSAGVGATLIGGAVGGGANVSYQFVTGNASLSYLDVTIAAIVGAVTQGKGFWTTEATSITGAYIGSELKGNDPTTAVIGAGIGAGVGSIGGKLIKDKLTSITNPVGAEVGGAVGGTIASEYISNKLQN